MERFHQKSNANNWVKTKQSVSFHSKSQLKKTHYFKQEIKKNSPELKKISPQGNVI